MDSPEEAMDKEIQVVEELRQFIEEQTTADNFSGAVLMAKEDKKLLEEARGFANKETQTPNSAETVFNLGSVSKTFTAVAVAQLVEQGRLSFEGKIGEYLPQYANTEVKDRVTIHQLLTHTSGLGHYLKDKNRYLKMRQSLREVKDFVELFENEPLDFEPGTKYSYSGNGYELLGRIIEVVTGQNYFDYIDEHIFKVAGMENSGFFEVQPSDPNSNIAIGYTKRADDGENNVEGPRRDNLWINLIRGGAGGGGYSNCPDLLWFAEALQGNKLLSPEMTNAVMSPKVEIGTKNGLTLHYGYGFQILDMGDGHLRVGHGGSFAGASARFDIYPWLDTTVVSLSNYDEPAAHKIANKAGELLLQ